MGAYIKIYRAFSSKNYFYVKAFSEDHYEYQWASRRYPWLWMARWLGSRAAHAYINRGLAQLESSPVEILEIRPIFMGDGFFETTKKPGGKSTRVFIERIEL